MNFYYRHIYFAIFLLSLSCSYGMEESIQQHRVMSIDEFESAIENNEVLKELKMNNPLDEDEKNDCIGYAIKYESYSYGGIFDSNRNIDNFKGDTLVIGGGKLIGNDPRNAAGNMGKTLLPDINVQLDGYKKELLIKQLKQSKIKSDKNTKVTFETEEDRKNLLMHLQNNTLKNYLESKKNSILEKYYTINIEKTVEPDLLASITSKSDMTKIPNSRFSVVEFENVPDFVLLNPQTLSNLERITKPGGTIKFTLGGCSRLIVPVIEKTKFGKEYLEQFKEHMRARGNYSNVAEMHENITLKN